MGTLYHLEPMAFYQLAEKCPLVCAINGHEDFLTVEEAGGGLKFSHPGIKKPGDAGEDRGGVCVEEGSFFVPGGFSGALLKDYGILISIKEI